MELGNEIQLERQKLLFSVTSASVYRFYEKNPWGSFLVGEFSFYILHYHHFKTCDCM